jgi:hypothetical protein
MNRKPHPAPSGGDPAARDQAPHAHLDREAMAAALRVVLGPPGQRRDRRQGVTR